MIGPARLVGQWLGVALLIYLLIVAVALIGRGSGVAVGGRAEDLFILASNPFMGLVVGVMATALVQSSSTVTSIIVGLVAGGMPVVIAVPIVMGANVGTTITNTLVSLGHVADEDGFRRAFAAATVHDFFNLLSIAIFLPLELMLHLLERSALILGTFLLGDGAYQQDSLNFVGAATEPLVNFIAWSVRLVPRPYDGILMIACGVALILVTITLISRVLRRLMVGRVERVVHASLRRGPMAGIAAGTAITVVVQSSSTTTSLIVPLAGAGLFGLAQVYPFTLGANIGTCVTALLAATAITGVQALPALQIALVQLLYNVLGVIVVYGVPWLRRVPVATAERLSAAVSRRKAMGLFYVLVVFFGIPGILLAGSALF